MNCGINSPNYRSSNQFYNNTTQALTDSSSSLEISNNITTKTGVAISNYGSGIAFKYPGLYRVNVAVTANATTAGVLTFQLYLNGEPLPDTLKTITVPVGYAIIELNVVKYIKACGCSNPRIQLYAKTDGTAVANVVLISGNAVKLT